MNKPRVEISETMRGIVSLVIFVHLFCVAVGLFANESTSVLAVQLRRVLGPYIRLLNLDPQFLPGFHLTHAMEYEDHHQLVIEVAGEEPIYIPNQDGSLWGERLGFRQPRYLNLTRQFGLFAEEDNDQAMAELARAIGGSLMTKTGAKQMVLRCQRLGPHPLDPVMDQGNLPIDTLYRADVIVDDAGVVRVHKQVNADEAAPVRGS